MITGRRGAYLWIVWDSQFMDELVQAVPQVVVGKFVIITSFDSGPFVPSQEETGRGWRLQSGLAYSPQIKTPDDLPHDQYDEWYIYSCKKEIHSPEVFINFSGFQLKYYAAEIELHGLLERFWLQMEKLQPESYLAEGGSLILATRDEAVYEQALAWKFRLPEKS
jgi:hypothetical protein